MNHAVGGKPGGGKGLWAMHLINVDVTTSRRPVLTDLAVEKNPWCAGYESRRGYINYLHQKHGQTYEMEERLFRLKPKAMSNFFLYRALNRQQVERLGSNHLVGYREVTPLDDVLEDSEWQFHKDYKLYVADIIKSHEDKRGRVIVDEYDTRLSLASGGHLCVMDEAWKHYPARNWSNTGEGILYYCSMVRRFGDDNWLISQRFADCDSILVDRCQDFYTVTNHGKLKFGPFKQPGVYQVCVFDQRPTPSSDPMSRKAFTLDRKGLAQCYDTSGGVGVTGRVMADVGRKTAGVPLWVIPIVGLCAIWLVWQGFKYGNNYVHGLLSPKNKSVAKAESKPVPAKKNAPFVHEKSAPQEINSLPASDTSTQLLGDDQAIVCTGYCVLNGQPVAFLSDGSTVEPPDLQVVGKRYVVVNGDKIPMKILRALPVVVPQVPSVLYPSASDSVLTSQFGDVASSSSVDESTVHVTYIGQPRDHTAPRVNGFASLQNQFRQ